MVEVQNNVRIVVNTDNFIQQITPYLELMSNTWQNNKSTHDEQQDHHKKYADEKRRKIRSYTEDRVWVPSNIRNFRYQIAFPDHLYQPLWSLP